MDKPSASATATATTILTTTISDKVGMSSEILLKVADILQSGGTSDTITVHPQFESKDFYSNFIRALLKIDRVERGRVYSLFSVRPPVLNAYGGLHGGVVASLAEMMSIACARTVVGEDKEIFLGELSTSYLSVAPCNVELRFDASVIRSGRNITVIAVEFKVKDTGKLTYISQATFYNMLSQACEASILPLRMNI